MSLPVHAYVQVVAISGVAFAQQVVTSKSTIGVLGLGNEDHYQYD